MFEMLLLGKNNKKDTGPGPTDLIGYYKASDGRETGYYGMLTAADFINSAALKSAIGLTAGTVYNSSPRWGKFLLDGKTVFIALDDTINAAGWKYYYQLGCVYGDGTTGKYPPAGLAGVVQNKTISFGDHTYAVRLPRCAVADPVAAGPIENTSEWGRLMYPIASDMTAASTESGQKWASVVLNIESTSFILGVESASTNTTGANVGPFRTVNSRTPGTKDTTSTNARFRPILELVS